MARPTKDRESKFPTHLAEKIELKKTSWLKPYKRNSRTHSETQLDEIAASIVEFGFTNPILARSDGTIIAGHGRHLASTTRLDMTEVPVIILDYLSDTQAKALVIADNKLSDNAGWDEDMLALELRELEADNFDLSITGFDDMELEEIFGDEQEEEDESGEGGGASAGGEEIEIPKKPVTKLGDVWILGKHRLMCGDSTNKESVEILMKKERAHLLHTDPPYNVDYSNASRPKPGKKNLGKIQNDKMDDSNFYTFLFQALTNGFDFCQANASAYVWYSDAETENFFKASKAVGFDYNQVIIWSKPMLLSRKNYQWAHEPCLFLTKGKPYFTKDRTKTTVWDFGGYDKSNNEHPTQKPLFLPEEAIKNSTEKNAIVLDLFGGSGSTLLAAHNLGRQARLMEIDTAFCDVIIERWQRMTKKKATLEASNKTFAAVKKQRLNAG